MINVTDSLTESIFPILYNDEKCNIRIAGTAILAEHNGQPFLLTAAHVLRDLGRQYPLYILLGNKAIALEGPAVMTKMANRQQDLDIAYFQLSFSPPLLAQLTGYKTITLRDYDGTAAYAREHYFVFGYPRTKAKYRRKGNEFRAKPFRYLTDRITNHNLNKKYDRPDDSYILVHYRRRASKNKIGRRQLLPDPYGISGGTLFRALVDDSDTLILLILEGLLLKLEDFRVIVATRTGKIRDFIETNNERTST